MLSTRHKTTVLGYKRKNILFLIQGAPGNIEPINQNFCLLNLKKARLIIKKDFKIILPLELLSIHKNLKGC